MTLPHTNHDPATVAARVAKAAYEQALRNLRSDGTLSDLERARRISQAHTDLDKTLNEHANDLHQRRVAHYQEVESRVKIGADIPDGTSPADRAVLMSAFMTALGQVRDMKTDDLERTYLEAARFGDHTTLRAIETVVIEEGGSHSMREVIRSVNPDRVTAIEELATARELVENRGIEGAFASQAFGTPAKPSEAINLPTLEMHEEQRQQAFEQSIVRGAF